MHHKFERYSADTPFEQFASSESMTAFRLYTWADLFKTDPRASSSSSKVVQIGSSNRPQGSSDTLQLPIKEENFDASPFRFNALANLYPGC